MTTREWKSISEQKPKFYAKVQFPDGEIIKQITYHSNIEDAQRAIQPEWKVKIKILSLNAYY